MFLILICPWICGLNLSQVAKRDFFISDSTNGHDIQYIPRNMHTLFALLCFVVVIHWLIFPYPSGLLHWHCGNLTIAPVPAKQPWWIWINTSCEFIMNDCITTTKQSTTKPCAYFLGYTIRQICLSVLAHDIPRDFVGCCWLFGTNVRWLSKTKSKFLKAKNTLKKYSTFWSTLVTLIG